MNWWSTLILILLLPTHSVRADIYDDLDEEEIAQLERNELAWATNFVTRFRRNLTNLDGPTRLYCTPGTLSAMAELNRCRRYYDNFFSQPETDVRIVLGHNHRRNGHVRDRMQAAAISNLLRSPCTSPRFRMCDFTRDPDDAEVFRKTIRYRGRRKVIRVRLTPSSSTSRRDLNRAPENRVAQHNQTLRAKHNLISGLQSADAVFYMGHWGGSANAQLGPDDRAIRRQQVTDALRIGARRGKPKFLGMLGCRSNNSRDAFAAAGPTNMMQVTTNTVVHDDHLFHGLMSSVNNLLGQKCGRNFDETLNPPTFQDRRLERRGGL